MVLIHQMPCIRHNHHDHRCFLPHFPSGPMRCEFSSELVPPLPHAMREAFPKLESEPIYGSPSSPLSPPTLTSFQLILKPPGGVSHVSCGGYTLKNLLEGQHKWKSGLYDKIRVIATCSHVSIILRPLFRKRSAQWPTDIWIYHLLFPVKLRVKLTISVKWCVIYLSPRGYAIHHTPGI